MSRSVLIFPKCKALLSPPVDQLFGETLIDTRFDMGWLGAVTRDSDLALYLNGFVITSLHLE